MKISFTLKAFLYLLIQHIPSGRIEHCIKEAKESNHTLFENKHLESYIKDIIERLLED